MGIKVLTDFDGVWTDQVREAESVKLHLVAEACRLSRAPLEASRQHFEQFEKRVRSRPHSYGWAPDGRITAYVDEDPFCLPGAIAAYLAEENGDEMARSYREAILGCGFANMNAFADRCFHEATTRFRSEHPPAIVPGARGALEALWAMDAEVVVASNSPTEKLVDWFGAAGVDAGTDHASLVRVRGSAGKQTLGQSDEQILVSGRAVYVDRPLYRELLAEEQPDLVVGDVFSLDLALPQVLRSRRDPGAPRTLVLRRHEHTPAWVADSRAGGAIDWMIDGVEELAGVALKLTS